MKQILLLMLVVVVTLQAQAQDRHYDKIILRNGNEFFPVKIVLNDENTIQYKKIRHHHQSRETYSLPTTDVLALYFKKRKVIVDEPQQNIQQPTYNGDNYSENTPKYNNQPNYYDIITKKDTKQPVAQSGEDLLYFHNGAVIQCHVLQVGEMTITFIYNGESSQQVISKYAIQKIVHSGTGRVEKMSDKVIVSSPDDWENVIIVEDVSAVAGLTRVGDVEGSKKYSNSKSRADSKATRRLKQDAAEAGCQFILLTNSNIGSSSGGGTYVGGRYGGSVMYGSSANAFYKGIGYKY